MSILTRGYFKPDSLNFTSLDAELGLKSNLLVNVLINSSIILF